MNVRLVQSRRFPNVWSIVDDNGDDFSQTWRDPMFANGAMAAENAVEFARNCGYQIVGIDLVEGDITDARTGRKVDPANEVIAGIEYRSRRPVLDRWEYVDHRGNRVHVISVYSNGVASILHEEDDRVLTDERPLDSLLGVDLVLSDGTRYEGRLQTDGDGRPVVQMTTCGACGFTWNDALITSLTPVPAGRCPNEYNHEEE